MDFWLVFSMNYEMNTFINFDFNNVYISYYEKESELTDAIRKLIGDFADKYAVLDDLHKVILFSMMELYFNVIFIT